MTKDEITFTVCTLLLSLGLVGVLLECGAFQVPRDLRDPQWGTLPEFEAALRPIKRGATKQSVIGVIEGKPHSTTNMTDVTCLWKSQPFGYFSHPRPACRRYTYSFDSNNVLTNIVMNDNAQEDGGGSGLFEIIFR